MKLVKKITTGIVMVAMCCTMVVPMVATAGTGACPGHVFDKVQTGSQILSAEYYVHSYTNSNGEEATCRVQLVENFYKKTCLECGYVETTSELKEVHMNPNCPQV